MQDGDKQPGDVVAPGGQKPADEPEQAPAQWQFKADDQPASTASSTPPDDVNVSWTASEFISHEKETSWYGMLGLGGAALAALIYLLTRDIISTVMIVIVTVLFGVFAARKPRVLNYALDNSGLHIGQKFYPYGDFKSFSVVDEGGINGIWLMPLKRFMPSITIYFAPNDEDKIIDALSSFLPFEDRDHDVVDRLMRKVRF